MSKPHIEERFILAETKEELDKYISEYQQSGWVLYGPSRQESILDRTTGQYKLMFVQYACYEEQTTYNNWYRENRRFSINYIDD